MNDSDSCEYVVGESSYNISCFWTSVFPSEYIEIISPGDHDQNTYQKHIYCCVAVKEIPIEESETNNSE